MDEVQNVANKVGDKAYNKSSGAAYRNNGVPRHSEFTNIINKKGSDRLVAEVAVDGSGNLMSIGKVNNKAKANLDVVILKKGVTRRDLQEALENGQKINMKDIIDVIGDLKTGKANKIPSKQLKNISKIFNKQMISAVSKGGSFKNDILNGIGKRMLKAAPRMLKYAKGPLALGLMFLTYQQAKADYPNMGNKGRAAYAMSSVIGGDLAYDVGTGVTDFLYAQSHNIVSGVGRAYQPGGRVNNLIHGIETNKTAPNTSGVDAWLDRVLKNGQGGRDYKPPSSF